MHLLPPSLEEMIQERHLVRVVNEVIDELDLSKLMNNIKEAGPAAIIQG